MENLMDFLAGGWKKELGVKELSHREVEIMKEENVTMKDIVAPGGYDMCHLCRSNPHVPGMWVCADCYGKRSK